MKSYIIGLAGHKGCGKDTVASMINYIFATGISRAKYSDWLIKRVSVDETYKDRIVHFADSLKDCLSIIYNIPRSAFDDRKMKDEMYDNFNTGRFEEINTIADRRVAYIVLTNSVLRFNSLNEELRLYNELTPVIKLRTLMQYFGTEVCRNNLGDNIWVKSAIGKIVEVAANRRLCLVPDVRFANEAAAIRRNDDSLYGGLIRINNDFNGYSDNDNHTSEDINFDVDFTIENNGTLTELFYKTLEICQKILLV